MVVKKRRSIAFFLAMVLLFSSIFTNNVVLVSADETKVTREDNKQTSKRLSLASWAGSGQVKGGTDIQIYADREKANDFADRNSYFTFMKSDGAGAFIPTYPFAANNWLGSTGAVKDSYYEIVTSTKGFKDIMLSYSMRGSKACPKFFKVSYSTDGLNYEPISDKEADVEISKDSEMLPFVTNLPEGTGNQEQLYIRFTVSSDKAINGGAITATATHRFMDIVMTGSPDESVISIVNAAPESGNVIKGQKVTLTTATSSAIYYTYNDKDEQEYNTEEGLILDELPAEITAYTMNNGVKGFPITYKYTQLQVAPVKASPNGGARVKGTEVSLSSETEGATILYSTDDGVTWKDYTKKIVLDTFPITFKMKATKDGYLDSAESEVKFTQRMNENYNIYFGQVHSHTSYSDGAGTCEQAFDYAKNTAKQIDFLAVTDHSNSFDNADKANILDGSMSEEWKEGHELADKFTDDKFVGIYGYEMTWSNGLGHMNTFKTDGFQSRTQSEFSTRNTALQNYYARLKTVPNSFSQFNHPGTTFGDFTDFSYYDPELDNLITLIEVGNGEGAIGSAGYFPSYEYYTRALDKGWHVAPTNNQDNHKGKWGDANTARTVVLADSLTRDNVYEALNNMRTYATEDNDLQIQYTLNDECMGTILDSKPNEVNIKVDVKDPTDNSVGKVEVIVNGGLSIAEKKVTGNEGTVEFKLPADYSYYYVRVTEDDKDIAVTAPVWIDKVEAVGISGVSTTETLPVKGQSLDITTEIYNNEQTPLELDSLEFSIDNQVIHTADLKGKGFTSIASCTTEKYTFDYTYNQAGSVNINVTLKGKLNGVSKIYKGVLNLKYVDPGMVTKVIIDGSHSNDYVTGYYGGNMGNFSKIAAQESVKVEIAKDTITDETLKDCNLLIISAPAKKGGSSNTGTYTVSHFENEFIQTVKNYVNKGGTVILSGIADYQDREECQTSTELNKLLEAMGATTRVNSDQAVDDTNNGGQRYRLYPTDYDKDSKFTKGIVEGQKYSAYSGCTVLIDKEAEVAGKATALIKGNETTFSENTKKFDEYYKEIEKGNAVMLVHETVGKSDIFVSGTVFMSDFEVKAELDNIWDLPYMNYNIMKNILDNVKKVMHTTNISEVRAANKGDVFAVEGTVTAGTTEGNAFFDTIYIQDDTAGINIFPINEGDIKVGQKVRVVGAVDEYLGDLELRVIEANVIDTTMNPIKPKEVSTKDAMDYAKEGGHLVRVEGTITDVIQKEGIVETIKVQDNSGVEARVFIDGYVKYSNENSKKLEDIAVVGKKISAVGLVSYDPDGARIRVRDRSEVVPVSSSGSNHSSNDTSSKPKEDKKDSTVIIEDKATESRITIRTKEDKNGAVTGYDADIEAKCMEGKSGKTTANLELLITDKFLESIRKEDQGKPVSVTLNIADKDITEQMAHQDVKSVVVAIKVPNTIKNSSNVTLKAVNLSKDVLKTAKEEKKSVTFRIADEKGKTNYSWKFKAKDLSNTTNIKSVNTVIDLSTIGANDSILGESTKTVVNDKQNGILLDFSQKGQLPAKATFKVNMNDRERYVKGQKVYVYHVGKNQLETIPKTEVKIDKDGYVSFQIKRGDKYVIVPQKASSELVSTLVDRTKVTTSKTMKKGQSGTINVTLPYDAKGEEKITYQSENKSIATVSKTGKVTSKKKGTTMIKTTVVINKEKKTYHTKITVK